MGEGCWLSPGSLRRNRKNRPSLPGSPHSSSLKAAPYTAALSHLQRILGESRTGPLTKHQRTAGVHGQQQPGQQDTLRKETWTAITPDPELPTLGSERLKWRMAQTKAFLGAERTLSEPRSPRP